jgi:hypothetical protein
MRNIWLRIYDKIRKENHILRTGKRIMIKHIIGNRTALNKPVCAPLPPVASAPVLLPQNLICLFGPGELPGLIPPGGTWR